MTGEPKAKRSADQQNRKQAEQRFEAKFLDQTNGPSGDDNQYRVSLPTRSDRLLSGKSVPSYKFAEERHIFPRGLSEFDGRSRRIAAQHILQVFVQEVKFGGPTPYDAVKMMLQAKFAFTLINTRRLP